MLGVIAATATGAFLPALAAASPVTAVPTAVIVSGAITAARQRARGEPAPAEALEASVGGRTVH